MLKATRCSPSWRTRLALSRDKSPSFRPPKRWNNSMAITALTSPSPRNSSRSLLGSPKLRWVRACRRRSGLPKAWPNAVSRVFRFPINSSQSNSIRRTAAGGGMESEYQADIGHDWNPSFVFHRQHNLAALPFHDEILRTNSFDIIDVSTTLKILDRKSTRL